MRKPPTFVATTWYGSVIGEKAVARRIVNVSACVRRGEMY
jgi:hypothetical protein